MEHQRQSAIGYVLHSTCVTMSRNVLVFEHQDVWP
jgi:hypothetical protein